MLLWTSVTIAAELELNTASTHFTINSQAIAVVEQTLSYGKPSAPISTDYLNVDPMLMEL